jgi:hypothetical protein
METHKIHFGDFQITKSLTVSSIKCDEIKCKKIICEDEPPSKSDNRVSFDLAPDKRIGYQYYRNVENIDIKEGINNVYFSHISKGTWHVSFSVHLTSHEEVEPINLTLGISNISNDFSYSYPMMQHNNLSINPSFSYSNNFIINSTKCQDFWLLAKVEPEDKLISEIFVQNAVFTFTRLSE